MTSETNLTCIEKCPVPVEFSGHNFEGLDPRLVRVSNESLSVYESRKVELQCPDDLICAYSSGSSFRNWESAGERNCNTYMYCRGTELKTSSTKNLTCSETCEVPTDLSGLNSSSLHALHFVKSDKPLAVGLGIEEVPVQCPEDFACAYLGSRRGEATWIWPHDGFGMCKTQIQCEDGQLKVAESALKLTCAETFELPADLSGLNISKLHPLLSLRSNASLVIGLGEREADLQCPQGFECAWWDSQWERWRSAPWSSWVWNCAATFQYEDSQVKVVSQNLTCSEMCDVPVDLSAVKSDKLHPLHSRIDNSSLAVGIGSKRVSLKCRDDHVCAKKDPSWWNPQWQTVWGGCETELACVDGQLGVVSDHNLTCIETCEVPTNASLLNGLRNSSSFHPLLSVASEDPVRVSFKEKTVDLQCPEGFQCAYWSQYNKRWTSARWNCRASLRCEGRELSITQDANLTCLETCEVPHEFSGQEDIKGLHPLLSRRSNEPLTILDPTYVQFQCPESFQCAYWSERDYAWKVAESADDCSAMLQCEDGHLTADRENLTCRETCNVPLDASSLNSDNLHPLLSRASNETLTVGVTQRVYFKCPDNLACAVGGTNGGIWWGADFSDLGYDYSSCYTYLECQEGQLIADPAINVTCSETCEVPVDLSVLNSDKLHPLLSRQNNYSLPIGIGAETVFVQCPEGYDCAEWSSVEPRWGGQRWMREDEHCRTQLQCKEGQLTVANNFNTTCIERCIIPDDLSPFNRSFLHPSLRRAHRGHWQGATNQIGMGIRGNTDLECPENHLCAYWSTTSNSWLDAESYNECRTHFLCDQGQLKVEPYFNLTCLEKCNVPLDLSSVSGLDPLLSRQPDSHDFVPDQMSTSIAIQCPEGYKYQWLWRARQQWVDADSSSCRTSITCQNQQLSVHEPANWSPNPIRCRSLTEESASEGKTQTETETDSETADSSPPAPPNEVENNTQANPETVTSSASRSFSAFSSLFAPLALMLFIWIVRLD
uniref:Uncharacterized protein n=1 Tax=Chromera velia CCMP2878 TaxID=1169474 RepID=A0A0G4I6U0_9ALVE|eukprot:Cvel_11474.t1-p1 / transcript=Cvel_11474.t1 / gene=Cvel_11474 / organism=Chromera_velia_CCMP2878 / gene_product=hypothetical protein / transcript_product=hypothetical protein / location=Cvel_scaffold722:46333-52602(-) / protein_length=998 / sequence_SO=supercontig / SO=protein_coding / is_pseudo=false